MLFSLKILVMALDTLPESTIIESTTMSLASGSRPMCTSSTSPRDFFSSTALMLLEPMSRPTIAFVPPIPNIRLPLLVARGRAACGLRFLLAPSFSHAALALHPGVQDGFLELPAVAQLESGDAFLVNVLIKRVGTHAQVLRRLANVHHFTRIGHITFSPFLRYHATQGGRCLLARAFEELILFSTVLSGGNLQCACYTSVAGGCVKRLLPVSSGFLGYLRRYSVAQFGNPAKILGKICSPTTICCGIDVVASQFCLIES